MGAVLEVLDLTKFFGGVKALAGLSFSVNEGELLGLMGPNGAGKTTLFNLISGIYKPSKGRIYFRGTLLNGLSPQQIARLGVGRTYQIPQPFFGLTVAQNVMVSALYAGCFGEKEAKRVVHDCLEVVGLLSKKDVTAEKLTLFELRQLEIARALAGRPRLLLLDEVAAGLSLKEVPRLFELIQSLKGRIAIIMVEHVVSLLVELADRILFLHEGKKAIEGSPRDVINSDLVVQHYLGRKSADLVESCLK